MIALLDYGAGNLTSVRKGLAAAGADVRTPDGPRALEDAAGIVVPGVGHYAATAALGPDWRQAIADAVGSGTPLLGICLGLQWLFDGSDEAPGISGLGAMSGRCVRLPDHVKVPHVGWNTLHLRGSSRLLEGIAEGTFAYFTHSYAAPVGLECAATTACGTTFASVVERGRVFGVQFHPEKSGQAGIRILSNFLAVTSRR